ncbi:hypothetical protein KCP78_21930 [Salmonella enterica subsp. enterica]|nr:hypothetical protein KCP78_21930 [Salmonella enterica subsp. enterica]
MKRAHGYVRSCEFVIRCFHRAVAGGDPEDIRASDGWRSIKGSALRCQTGKV